MCRIALAALPTNDILYVLLYIMIMILLLSSLVLKCDDPPVPSNGDFVTDGFIVTYMCEEGYILVGNRQRFCNLTTWIWNGTDPTCEGN